MARAPCDVFNNFLNKIMPNFSSYNVRNKEESINDLIKYSLNRTARIFKWNNLPDSIPQRILELYLQVNGNVAIYEYKNKLYPFVGGLGGEPDPYYMPTIYTIANPALNLSVNAKINSDCIVIPNDTFYMGLFPMIQKYSTLIVENELSLYINLINSRVPALVGADNSGVADSANMMFNDIERGKIGVVATNQFFDGLKTFPYSVSASHTLTDLLEVEQYLKASLYNDLGLQSNFNMKRERLTDDETALNETALLPLIDDMLYYRKEGAKRINEKYGTNITVDISSGWKLTQDSAYAENVENEENTDGGGEDGNSENID